MCDHIRSLFSVVLIAVLSTALGCAAGTGGQYEADDGPVGSAGLELTWDDRQFNFVDWSLRGTDNDQSYVGRIDITNVVYNISTIIEDVVVGHYRLELTAISDDGGKQTCRGHVSDIEIAEDEVAQVSATMLCDAPEEDTGGLHIETFFDDCPAEIRWLSAAPARAEVGEQIALSLNAGADWSSIEWSADSGTFDRQNSSETNYTCTEPGMHTITVAISSIYTDCPTNTDDITIECVEDF